MLIVKGIIDVLSGAIGIVDSHARPTTTKLVLVSSDPLETTKGILAMRSFPLL
jgi:hypothetical protein